MNTIEIIAALKAHKVIPRLAGEQLKLMGETSNLPAALMDAVKNAKEELIFLLRNTKDQLMDANILPVSRQQDHLASDAQKSIWMLHQLDETGGAYNIVTGLYLKGTVSVEILNSAFLYSIQRHESLRTVFKEVDGTLRQVISDDSSFELAFEDISGVAGIHAHLKAEVSKLTYQRFDLENGPLLKVKLMRISDQEYALVFVIHHIISDGWSVKILLQEVMHFYEASRKGEAPAINPLKIQYKDYAAWLFRKLEGSAGQHARTFWKDQLSIDIEPLVLPSDLTRPAIRAFEGAIAKFFPGNHFYPRILQYCKQHTTTPFNFLLATFSVLLHKLSGQNTITIGTPVAGRTHFDLQHQIGLFVNALPLITQVNVEDSFVDLLKNISGNTLRTFECQDYPFARITEDLEIKRDTGRNPLFDVMLVLQDTAIGDGRVSFIQQSDFELSRLDSYLYGPTEVIHESAPSKFDLTFNLGNDPDNKFYVEVEYSTNLFTKDNIILFYNAYQHIISQVLAHPEERIKNIELADQEESYRLLSTFNATDVVYASGKTVVDLFEEQVLRTPEAIGLLYEGRSLSYQQLNETANRLSHYLRQVYQIGSDDLIGIQLERSEWLVISMLGVLKSGGAYVPIDPAYPQERIDYIIADSRCKVVLDARELQKFLLHEEKYSKANAGIVIHSTDLAYVIYTSGSTGQPKGVMITHSNVYSFIEWCREEFSGADYEVVLGVTSICFDLSVFEIFFTLISGKRLRLLESALSVPKYLNSQEPLLLNTVPSVVSHLLSEGADLSRVNVLNMAGEPIPASTVRQLDCNRIEVRNLYGPSEDTTYSTVYRISSADSILIGRPISNTKIYILSDHGQLQPVGVAGEICISGAGLARGYLNQPALTAEKFIPHPFIAGERLYKTGDIGKWQPDGNIVYLGRKDDQVKIRGYRIELGEIENVLQHYAGVTAAVVTARLQADGDKTLVAYVVGKEPLDNAVLRSHLKSYLPDYMVPDYYIQLEAIPLLPNGKVNRKALPAPEGQHLTNTTVYEAPRNVTEFELVQIWQQLLRKEQIGVKDNFFELGGHSLKATRLASQLYRTFEVKIALKDLFSHPVLEDQARLITGSQKTSYVTIPEIAEQTDYVLSSAQRRLWVLSQFEEGSVAYNMPGVFEFEGSLDIAALSTSFDTLINRHESLRTVFRETTGGEVRQYILSSSSLAFRIGYFDLRKKDELTIRQVVESTLYRPFDLSNGPLLRADLYQTEDDKWIFSYAMHHIVSDGWSMEVLIKELLQSYDAYVQGQSNPLQPLRIHYKDYAVWQQQQLNNATSHKNYWLGQFSGELPVLELPADKVRPAVKTHNGSSLTRQIDAGVTAELKALCQSSDSTLFMGLVAAVNALLYRYTGQEDIILGSPVAGREHSDLEEQIGFYVNTLALRTQFSGADSYQQLLARVRQITLDAYEHQSYPFDELVEELPLQRDMSRSALFDVLVVMQHESSTSLVEQGFSGLQVKTSEGMRELSKFDLQFNFIAEQDTITVRTTYNTDIYHQDTIKQLLTHFEQLLSAISTMPATSIVALEYLSAAERQTLLHFNQSITPTIPGTLIAAFKQQVASTPDNIALVFEQTRLTYRELDEASDKLAVYLRATYRLKADELVGIQLERSEWMIIALWGILKSGAAFVPIDPGYPQERIDYMIADSSCRVVINEEVLHEYRAKDIIGTLENITTPDDLAYVIYTSGSTGRPKGVMISHGSLYQYIKAIGSEYGIDDQERIVQVSNFAFDAAVEQIMLSMLHGACLHVISQGLVTDTIGLTAYIADNGITHLHTVPTLLQDIDYRLTGSLKRVVSAGEPCPLSLLQNIEDNIIFYNKYGPTEATISATLYRSIDKRISSTTIPIGHPLSNSRVYILNEQGGLQPSGVVGEICIGGGSLARGYLNQPALTAERFVSDPYHPGALMYRTGDLGKWLPDGNIVYLGRKDDQVKIRGHRIEPGEITQVLQEYAGVGSAVVTAIKNSDGDTILVAYLVSTTELNITGIRRWLGSKLPHYMVPVHFIQLNVLPLLPNGKLNKKALPVPEAIELSGSADYVAPRNATEIQLVEIWQQILGREQIGIKDNFFELGGHSLKATRLASQLYKVFNIKPGLKELFIASTIEAQAAVIAQMQQSVYVSLLPAPVESHYPLSSAQRRLWVLSQFEEGSVAYNMPGVFEFEGSLDIAALSTSFDTLINRHESLRTVFRETAEGEVRQCILSSSSLGFRIGYFDLRKKDEATIRQMVESSLYRPFDLSNGPLLRADLYQADDNKWIFSYVMHHIISDGWSMEVLIRELLQLYHAYVQGESNPLVPLRIHYKDYAVWQQQQLNNATSHKNYWLGQLNGELPVLEFPTDKVRPAVKTYNGSSLTRQIDAGITAGLKALCQSSDSTLFMGLVAAVNALLYRYTGQEDIILGSPIAGREHSDLEDQIGFYVNTLALRTQFSGADSYQQLLARVRQITLDAYQHQSYPFDELVEELPLKRDMSRSALFDVLVVLQHQSSTSLVEKGLTGLEVRTYEGMRQGSKFDLQFSFVEAGDQLQLQLTYNTDIYYSSTIAQLASHLEQLLAAIIAMPTASIGRLAYLSATEQQTLFNFNQATTPAIPNTLVTAFKQQAASTPDNIALVFEQTSLTFRELDEESDKLAIYLRDTYRLKVDDLVGIQLERSEWMIIALLGILKAGAAFVPIDPAYPQDRIDYIIADSRCKVVLDETELKVYRSKDKNIIEVPADINTPDNLAYVIYTSGSTGRPKGVMISHDSLYQYIRAIGREYGISEQERIVQVSNFAFDAAVEQIMLSILNGAALYVISQSLVIEPTGLTSYIADNGITHLHTVPTLLQHIDYGSTVSLRRVVSAGEPCPLSLLQSVGNDISFYNKYGPTETTISATLYKSVDKDAYVTTIPIGHPLSNSRVYILNDYSQLQPVGIAGEIYIGGNSLARGYLNQPALTAERFLSDPYHPGECIYRTGDIGKWQSDGNIVFLGRKDDQVKIRGHRIELGEIEHALQCYAGVTTAAVIAHSQADGDKALVAYVVCTTALDVTDLRRWLGSKLPHYMLPAHFIQLDVLPLLPNGKLNKKALPAPESMELSGGTDHVAPRNTMEIQLVQIWQDILGREQIGIKDNFFELGGHSLKVTRLASRLHKVFGVKPGLKELFSASTIEAQAAVITQMQQSVYVSLPPAPVQSHYPLSSAQRRLWVLSQFEEGSVAYHMPGVFEFEGTLDTDALSTSFDTLIARHESLRTVFRETEGGEVKQYILSSSALRFKIGYHDLRREGEANIRQMLSDSLSQPFDLSNGPLLRADLYQADDNKWIFGYVMHHIISDGWSMEVLIKELLQLYNAYVQGEPNPLSPLRIHYKDYAVWQQQQLNETLYQSHKNYWLGQLSGELPVLELPVDKIRPAVKTYNGASLSRQIDAGITAELKALCQSSDSTLFMGLLAAVNVLLYRYTGQEDIIIGSPVAGREHNDLEDQIGFYVNTLALRTQFSGADSYQQLLARVKQLTLDAYQHQSYPFDELVDELPLQRDMSRSALFDVLLVMQHQSSTSLVEKGFSGLQVRTYEGIHQSSKFDLQFSFVETDDQLQLYINYNNDLFHKDTIVQLLTHLEQLLEAIIATPEKGIGTLAFLSLSEQNQLLETFNATTVPYALDKSVVDLLEEQMLKTPDHIGLLYEGGALSYRELNETANQLAHYLKQVYDVSADDLIGIQLERSEWLIISLLGVLKSGGAYVPIDPAYPQDRIDYIVADSQCKVVLDIKELDQFRANADNYSIENPLEVIQPTDLAYVIYTSGSTGRPKGVMITHGNVYAFMEWCKEEFNRSDYEVVLGVTSVCFDLSVFEIFYTLVSGKQLRLLMDALSIPQYLNSPVPLLLNTVPSVVDSLLSTGADLSMVSVLNMAGEPIPTQTIRQLDCDRIAVRNLYGPSEDTTYSTVYRIKNGDSILIGRPISNTRIYILNDHGSLQPVGVTGEICISGAGLARGYLNQPVLTAEKFVPHPFIAGGYLYKTGDLGKWQSDGNIVYLGRKDDQVKIRGYRVELGEITEVLQGYPGVAAGVVTNIKDSSGDNVLVAYVVCTAALDVADLRRWLGSKLPHYMLPAHFIQLDALPRLPNGKLNKKALPVIEGLEPGTAYVAPRNEIEAQLVQIWQHILGREQVGVQHNFFELGGHSLKATRLVSQVQKEFGINVNIKDVFMNPTIETVGELIRAGIWLERSKNNSKSKEDRTLIEI